MKTNPTAPLPLKREGHAFATRLVSDYRETIRAVKSADAAQKPTAYENLAIANARLIEIVGVSNALLKVGLDQNTYDLATPAAHQKFANLAAQAIPLMQESGELAEREVLWQRFFGPDVDQSAEGHTNRFWLAAQQIAEQYRTRYLPVPTAKRSSRVSEDRPEHQMLFSSNTINNGAISFISNAAHSKPMEDLAYGQEHRYKDITVTYGLPNGEKTESLFTLLSRCGPETVKAHFALWARWYEDDGRRGVFMTVRINQFCEDIGYTRHNGAFRREQKQRAKELLEAITSIEMRALYRPPGSDKPTERMRGAIWARGMMADELQHENLFGRPQDGKEEDWEPASFSFAPGPWFSHPEYSRYNMAIGKVGFGLMQLQNNTDEWAILIGGYIGTMLRPAQYHTRRLAVATILMRTGLAQSKDAERRNQQTEDKFRRALDRLVEVNVISSWRYTDDQAEDIGDAADAEEIAAYYSENAKALSDWRRRVVEISCPFEEDAERLTTQTTKALETQKRKRGRPKKTEK